MTGVIYGFVIAVRDKQLDIAFGVISCVSRTAGFASLTCMYIRVYTEKKVVVQQNI